MVFIVAFIIAASEKLSADASVNELSLKAGDMTDSQIQ